MRYTMKRGVILGVLAGFLAFTLFSSFASAYEENFTSSVIGSPSIQISSLRYEPYPVEPNEQFTLWIKVQNIGSHDATDARCRIVPQKPFSLYTRDAEKSYGLLGTNDFAVFDFSLKVDENAVDGDNELIVECTPDPSSGWIRNKVIIKIQTRYPTLNIINVKTVPDFVEPGSKAQLLITLENMAYTSMKDISVKPDFSSVSLAPYQEMGEKKIQRMEAGEIKDLVFNIVALPDAKGGIYKVPLSITFTDELGKEYSITGTIAVEVNSEPNLEVYVDSSTLTSSSKTGKVVFKIVNKGLTDIKFMNVKLLPDKKINILSTGTVYVGNVDSDDFETVDFTIEAKGNTINLPLKLEYKDINNGVHNESINVAYNLPSGGKTNWWLMVILLALAVLIFFKRKAILEKIKKFRK